ncbi:DUF6924 domain-containing protein [Streptomyces anthocyanicus]|uniref:DUF6924 domain-containing protein n=1 Tax=Streptomyces anthocyanicus TaxID=68174 RepID=UPI002F917ABF
MKNLPQSEATLLIRTDFSDEDAWQALRTAVTTPYDGDEDEDEYEDEDGDEDDDFLAMLHIVDDPAYGDLTAEQIVALAPAEDGLMIVADKTAMTAPGMPLLAVHVNHEAPVERRGFDELRVVARQLWSIENNLAIANMDWVDFVDAADEDGVFRGF